MNTKGQENVRGEESVKNPCRLIDVKIMKNLSQHNLALFFDSRKELKVTRNSLEIIYLICETLPKAREGKIVKFNEPNKRIEWPLSSLYKLEVFSFVIERDDSLK